MTSVIRQFLEVPSTDPGDVRRTRLLNILLVGTAAITLLALIVTVILDGADLADREQLSYVYPVGLAMLIGIGIVFAINHQGWGWLASSLFLLLFIVALVFSARPQEVVAGHTLFMFAIPILVAGVILPASTCFILAGLIGLSLTVLALSVGLVPNPYALLGLLAMAVVSWLTARSLERALEDLDTVNQEIDQRVNRQTRDVRKALSEHQAILAGIADGVIVFDTDGQAVVANPAIAELLERAPDEIAGYDLETLIGDGVDAEEAEAITGPLMDRERRAPNVRFEWGDKTLSVSVAPVRLASGDELGSVVVFRDCTRDAEVERMKSAFVSSASHELRTPLNAIIGYADMLREGVYGELSSSQRRVVERIIANTGHLLGMANNLLDQAQIEAGKLTLNITTFSIADLVSNVQSMMGVLAQSKGLRLTCHVTNDLPAALSGDRQRLHQILVNLVDNAIKFTNQGKVLVRVYRWDGAHYALEVTDTGRGIPAEAQDYIFEPFRQVDGSATREYTGCGLGLSIVKQLVTLMGGEITLVSEVGHGSTLTAVLPLIPAQEGSSCAQEELSWMADLR